jgi:hydroxyethylthiazole kinase
MMHHFGRYVNNSLERPDAMNTLAGRAAENLAAVRRTVPLVHNITNFVVMNVTANALLAVGASPVMAHASEEVEEMAGLADALVLNIGTLSREWVSSMILAGRTSKARGKTVVFDPVGAGATRFRTETACRVLADAGVGIVRGNASEICALDEAARSAADPATPGAARPRGVDAIHATDAAVAAAERLAAGAGVAVAVTGPTDVVTDGRRRIRVAGGHPLMRRVTGTGCTASALIAAFAAVDPDPAAAAATGLAVFGLAGEIAGQGADGPGTFMIRLLDALHAVTPAQVRAGVRIEGG